MRPGDTPQSGNHHEAVVLVIVAGRVALQFEVLFLQADTIRREGTVVRYFIDDAIDDAALPDEVPLAGEDFPAEPNFEDDGSVLVHRSCPACCRAVRPIAMRPANSSKLLPGASEPDRSTMPVEQQRSID